MSEPDKDDQPIREYIAALWAQDWNSPEDSAYDDWN